MPIQEGNKTVPDNEYLSAEETKNMKSICDAQFLTTSAMRTHMHALYSFKHLLWHALPLLVVVYHWCTIYGGAIWVNFYI